MADDVKTIPNEVPVSEETSEGTTAEALEAAEEIATETTTSLASEPTEVKTTRRRRRTTQSGSKATTDELQTTTPVSEEVSEETTEEKEAPPSYLPVIMIDKGSSYESEDEQQEIAWHSIKNAFLTRHILTGVLSGVETTPNDKAVIGVTYYEGYKIVIPAQEMIESDGNEKLSNSAYSRIISSMIGAEISYVILQIENETKTVVASRIRANERNRKTFYFDKGENGRYKIYEGSIVEARVIAVNRLFVTLELFGVITNVPSSELSWNWITDATELYAVGDRAMAKITEIHGRDDDKSDSFYVTASIKQAQANKQAELIDRIRPNHILVGTVLDIRKGTYIVQLSNGLQAISHNSRSRKRVMKGDTVSYVVSHVDKKTLTVIGSITRIIKQGRP